MRSIRNRRSRARRLFGGVAGLSMLLGVAAGVPASPAHAQTQTFTLYRAINFTEGGRQFFTDVADLTNFGFNDVTSSIVVPTGTVIAAYEAAHYGGRCETFRANDADLRNNTIGNDTISSVRIGRACPVVMWSESNYIGNINVISGDAPELPWQFSNDMASLKVQGNKVALFDLPNYGGICENFTGDDPDLGNNLIRQRTSSLRIGVDCPRQGAYLFEHINYEGAYIAPVLDENVFIRGLPAEWVNRVSSIWLADGVWLNAKNEYLKLIIFERYLAWDCERITVSDPDLRNNVIGNDGMDYAAAFTSPPPAPGRFLC